jgi:membrane protein
LSFSLKKVIALQIAHLIIKNFIQLKKPLTAAEIATELVIPIAIIQPVLLNLIASHIIVEFKDQEGDDERYQPAVDINILSIAYIINALEHCGQNHLPDIDQERLFMEPVNSFTKLMETAEQNRLLRDI